MTILNQKIGMLDVDDIPETKITIKVWYQNQEAEEVIAAD